MPPKEGKSKGNDSSERAALQNAVDAADRQIDQRVYDLYSLTPVARPVRRAA